MKISCLKNFAVFSCRRNDEQLKFFKSQSSTPESPSQKQHRVICKSGRHVRVDACNVPLKKELFLVDFFTTLMDAKWGWFFLIFSSAFLSSWLFFGTIWWLIAWLRLKFGSNRICVENVSSWTTAFLFSVETQTTIGYGGRQITQDCPEALVCILLQSLCGLTLSASLLGLIFAKLSRPRTRAETIMFSKNAVVALRDDKMCFMFRVADVRKSQLLEISIRLYFFGPHITAEGEFIPYFQYELPVCLNHRQCGKVQAFEARPFLVLPLTITHIINEKSPLYDIVASDLEDAHFEIVAVLEGIVESTGMVTQAKMSYIPQEIQWGYRFQTMDNVQRNKIEEAMNKFDYSALNNTYAVPTPKCSTKDYYRAKHCASSHWIKRPRQKEHKLWISRIDY